ncbi:MAG: apolipoprotein N-acyltransferase [Gammaproteobacteria bacterium]
MRPLTTRWPGELAAILAGGASVLAFAPFGAWPLAIVCPALLFALWTGVGPGRAAWRGFLYGSACFLAGIYWIYTAVSGLGPAPWWLGVLLYLALSFACAAFPALLGALARWLAPRAGMVWLLFLPAGWALGEWVRSFVLTGFPWLALGYSQVTWPLGGYAPVLGVYGVSFFCAFAAVLLLILLAPRARFVLRLFAFGGIAAVFGLGAGLGHVGWTHPAGPAFTISLVQGNVAQTVKWQPDMLVPTLALYSRLTREHWGSDVIVWPEDAVPIWYITAAPLLADLEAEALRHHSALVFGVPMLGSGDAAYPAVLSVSPFRSAYYKRHLVPFGEYFPVPDWIKRWLGAHALPYSSFTPGPLDQPPLQIGKWRAAVALCYEVAFGRLLIRQLPAAEFIINPSDDGWFGNSIALPQQFQMAQLAARATGRFLATATDDGITGIIGPNGEVRARLPTHQVGVLTGKITPYAGATPYVRWGNWFIVCFALFMLLAAFAWAMIAKGHRTSLK